MEPKKLAIVGRMNTPDYLANANISYAIRLQYPVARIMELQEENEAILIGGGPSLRGKKMKIEELISKDPKHRPIVTMNKTHDWALDHGLTPHIHVMMDARPRNAEFLKRPVETCKYLLASQCAPEIFRALEGYDVTVWHSANTKLNKELLDSYYMGFPWMPILGGCTVGTRVFHLLMTIGVANKFHLFGYDSCVDSDRPEIHHAYSQWSDTEALMEVHCMGRVFLCQPWMFQQAREFKAICEAFGDKFKLLPYGDGLIQHMINAGGNPEIKEIT